jgi:hypothetical protein
MPDAVVDVLFLLALSFASLAAGLAFRLWPEKFQEMSTALDGSIFLFGAEVHLRIVKLSGLALIVSSYVTLVMAAFKL